MYNETRRLLLAGADGIVFVADSQWDQMESNAESLRNLEENLKTHGLSLDRLPRVLQFNKRDLADVAPLHYMNYLLNQGANRVPSVDSVATRGVGVFRTLNLIAKMAMARFVGEHGMGVSRAESQGQPAAKGS
jgi:hypothetical protein